MRNDCVNVLFRRSGRHAFRQRRSSRQQRNRLTIGETLEPKQLLAVDVVNPFDDLSLATAAPVTIAITNQFDATDVLGTVVKFETNAPIGGTPGLTTTSKTDGSTNSDAFAVEVDSTLPTPELLIDINTQELGSTPSAFATAGNRTFFVATDATHGTELWSTDGTAAGTGLVADIVPGPESGLQPWTQTFAVGESVYFTARDGTSSYGESLWVSDSTAAGTRQLTPDGVSVFSWEGLVPLGGDVLFVANDDTYGISLWKTDGTVDGTSWVASTGNVSGLTAAGGQAFFSSVSSGGLWKTDGTAAGTVLVKDIHAGSSGSSPYGFAIVGSEIFFSADDGVSGTELWKSDGTEAGTVMVKDINAAVSGGFASGSWPSDLTAVGDTLFFTADDGVSGRELWQSDGTSAGTALVKEINAGGTYFPASAGARSLVAADGLLFFIADDGEAGEEVWVSDGTEAGTVAVSNFPDPHSGGDSASYASIPALAGATLFPTDSGIFFRTSDGDLWQSDGTAGGTVAVKEFPEAEPVPGSGSYASMAMLHGSLIFAADDGVTGQELWTSDGTESGTVLLSNIGTGTRSSLLDSSYYSGYYDYASGPDALTVNGITYFAADDGIHGPELWKTDGTAAGTSPVGDISPGGFGSYPNNFHAVGNEIFFVASDDTNGGELWKTDGTEAGTQLVIELSPGFDYYGGPRGTHFRAFTASADRLYFIADTYTDATDPSLSTRGLYETDGTAAGTRLLTSIESSYSFYGDSVVVVGDVIYFPAGFSNDRELWSYNLVTEVAIEAADLNSGWGASPSELTVLGSSIVFAADDGVAGSELWSYDTVAGTASRLADIAPGSSSSSPSQLVSLGGGTFFTADDGVNGRELWQTDGTPAGTRLVRDLAAGAASSSPLGLTVVNDQLYFLAQDGLGTERLWVSDGTPEGTVLSGLLLDNLVGFLGETAAGVLYVGSSAAVGNEVFVLPTDGSAATAVEPEGDVILSSRIGDGLYANGVPVRYDNDGLGGDAAVQIAKVFGVWDAIEAERVPQYGGDRNMLFAQGPTGAVYRIPADDVWRLYGVDQVGNAGSIPLFRSSPVAASSERTVPVEVAGTLPLRQDLLGRLFADGLPVTRDGQHVVRRWGDVANDTVLTAVAAELDSAALRLLWWAGDGTLREWRFSRESEGWVFASDSAITVADAGAVFGVTLSDVIVTS